MVEMDKMHMNPPVCLAHRENSEFNRDFFQLSPRHGKLSRWRDAGRSTAMDPSTVLSSR